MNLKTVLRRLNCTFTCTYSNNKGMCSYHCKAKFGSHQCKYRTTESDYYKQLENRMLNQDFEKAYKDWSDYISTTFNEKYGRIPNVEDFVKALIKSNKGAKK